MVEKFTKPSLSKYSSEIILFVFPIILLLLNSNWIFSPISDFLPDTWFYFAYFRYFYTYAPAFPSTIHYFVERITWNIPGYYIYHFLPPLQANYVLHLLVYYIAIFSLFGILNNLFNRRTALLGALFLGSYPWFLRSVGWDYVDGTGIAHMLLLIYLLTSATCSKNWKSLFFFAGIVHASLIITNLFWISFAPSWIIYFVALNIKSKRFDQHQLPMAATRFIEGNLIVIGVAGFFSRIVMGHYYDFFVRSLSFSLGATRDINNVKDVIRLYGHMTPYWHIIPLLAALIAAAKLLTKTHESDDRFFFPAVTFFAVAYGWLVIWHIFKIPYLIVFLYSSFILPASFLLFGALLSSKLKGLTNSEFNMVVFVALLVFVIPFILIIAYPSTIKLQGNNYLILLFICVFLTAFLFLKRKESIIFILVAFCALSFLGGDNAYVYIPDRSKARNDFNAIVNTSQTIDSYYPDRKYTDFRLWFRADKNYDTFFSVAALYLYPWGSAIGNPYSGKQHPSTFSLSNNDQILIGDRIVILSSESDTKKIFAEANHALTDKNVKLTLESLKEIDQGSTRFYLYFTKVVPSP